MSSIEHAVQFSVSVAMTRAELGREIQQWADLTLRGYWEWHELDSWPQTVQVYEFSSSEDAMLFALRWKR